MAGEGVGIPAMDPQVLVQLVFVSESLTTVGAFKRTEALSDEKVLQRCILPCKRDTEKPLSENHSSVPSRVLMEHLMEAERCRGLCRRR